MASTKEPNDALDYGALLQLVMLIPADGNVQRGCVVYRAESLRDAARTAWAKARAYDREHGIRSAAEQRSGAAS